MNNKSLADQFHSLKPWTKKDGFTKNDWDHYIKIAGNVQNSEPEVIKSAMEAFRQEVMKEDFNGQYESESKLFILLRVVFDLPEKAPANQRLSFKGWINWPEPDENGKVNLSWPVSWKGGSPALIAGYEGSVGEIYDAWSEYKHFSQNFKFRNFD